MHRRFAFALTVVAVPLCAALFTAAASPRRSSAPEAAPPSPESDPQERTVLITGANRGIGLEFARQYHQAGWNVIATARDPDVAAELKSLGVRIEPLDVADATSVTAMAKRLEGQPIDVLINNAGVSGEGSKLADLDLADFERVLQVNTLGPTRVTHALLANLRKGSGKTVVSISSSLGSIERNTSGGNYGYRESKAALNMFMRSIAADLREQGFICIAMSPGWVKTDMGGPNASLTPEQSISGMREVIDGLKPEDSGKFWNHDGTIMPW